jgi:hypothetical protein
MPIQFNLPLCPNCSRPMRELLAIRDDQPELTIFGCRGCSLSYFTTGQVSISGQTLGHSVS